MSESGLTSNRPYLIRALYEWISDNGLTPHLLVDSRLPGVMVPEHSIQNGKVVLNVSSTAVVNLEMNNDWLRFQARFRGKPMNVEIPVDAVIAIYARENGQGMMFAETEPEDGPGEGKSQPKATGQSHLKVIK